MAKAAVVKQESFFARNGLLVAILSIVFFVFANTLVNDYCMDDEIVTNNHPLTSQGISAIPEILKSPYFKADVYSYEYRPIVHISFALEHQFLGESAGMSHFVNLILYMVLVLVVFTLLRELFPSVNEKILAVVTLLFALHPTHTEVVASIKNRDEILALLFTFLAFGEAIKFSITNQWWRIFTVLICFNLAMGSKVTILPFALAIPLSISILLQPKQVLKVMALSILLPLFASFWIETFSFIQQLVLVAACVLVAAIPHAAAFWKQCKDFMAYLSASFKGYSAGVGEVAMEENTGYFVGSPVRFLKILLQYKWWMLLFVLLNGGVFLLGAPWWSWLLLMVGIVLVFKYSKSLEFRKLLLLCFIVLQYEVYLLIFNNDPSFSFFAGLIFCGIAWRLKLIHPIFFVVYLIPTIVVPPQEVIIPPYAFAIFCVPIFWFHSSKKYQRIIAYVLGFVFVGMIASSFFGNGIVYVLGRIFMLLLLASVVFYDWTLKRFSQEKFLLLFLLITTIAVQLDFLETKYSHAYQLKYSKAIHTTVNTIETASPPKIVPTASYRPVLFAEFPIAEFPQPIEKKTALAATALLKYLKLTVMPYPLAFYYGYKEIEVLPLSSFTVILSVLLHLLLVAAAVYFFKRNIFIAFGIGFYLVVISPFSTFFYPIPGVIADRYLFAPTLGFALVVVGVLSHFFKIDIHAKALTKAKLPSAVKIILAAVLMCYGGLSIARNADWKNRLTLFRNDIQHVENSAQAHNLLAFHLTMEAQKVAMVPERMAMLEEAVLHFKRATEIWPGFMNATYDLGRDLEQLGRWREAVDAYHRTFKIDTSFSDAIFRAGIMYENLSNADSAAICYEYVVKVNPGNAQAFNNLSFLYFKKQQYQKAIDVCKQAFAFNSQNSDPLVNIGKTFMNMSQTDSAVYYFEKAYQFRKSDVGLVQMLHQLWREKSANPEKELYYYNELKKMGAIR